MSVPGKKHTRLSAVETEPRTERDARARRKPPEDAPKEEKKAKELELDPRVATAVKYCLLSMTLKEITPEFEKEMSDAFKAALEYEIEVRLPQIADEYQSEIGLGCGVIGAGVTRFRAARRDAAVKGTVTEKTETKEPAP